MDLLITNIKELLQVRAANTTVVSGKNMAELPTIKNAFLVVHSGKIINFGPMANCPNTTFTKTIDASGKMLLPTWCDSHTHIVYAGNREQEFVDRIKGLSYADIAAKGGGILNSAKQLQNTPENDLYSQSKARLDAVIKLGTGAIEIKSGYGLTEAAELKMLRVIKRLKTDYNLPIKATFLGAHALPEKLHKQ
jgi:Imidazolonepropionase and related amidohydrolases